MVEEPEVTSIPKSSKYNWTSLGLLRILEMIQTVDSQSLPRFLINVPRVWEVPEDNELRRTKLSWKGTWSVNWVISSLTNYNSPLLNMKYIVILYLLRISKAQVTTPMHSWRDWDGAHRLECYTNIDLQIWILINSQAIYEYSYLESYSTQMNKMNSIFVNICEYSWVISVHTPQVYCIYYAAVTPF